MATDDTWPQVGQPCVVRVERRLVPGTVAAISTLFRVVLDEPLDVGHEHAPIETVWRHSFEVYAPEEVEP